MDLETDFLNEFKNNEKEYFKFYRKEVNKINIVYLYCNLKNELVYVKKDKKYIKNGIFDETMFFSIIQNYSVLNHKKYTFDSCNQYNFNLFPENVENFLNTNNIDNYYFMNTFYSVEPI